MRPADSVLLALLFSVSRRPCGHASVDHPGFFPLTEPETDTGPTHHLTNLPIRLEEGCLPVLAIGNLSLVSIAFPRLFLEFLKS